MAVAVVIASLAPAVAVADAGDGVRWGELSPLPDAHGFAGAFAGVSGGALMVAGGANFPDGYPWDGGTKVWHDRIFVLAGAGGTWRVVERRLPRVSGYGVSVSVPARDSVFFIGGGNAGGSHEQVIEARWDGEVVTLAEHPPLPVPAAMACGALVGDTIIVAGGTPDGASTHRRCFALDATAPGAGWRELDWPPEAAGRILAVAGVQGGEFFLISGCDLGSDAWDRRTYLRDAWAFRPSAAAWRRLADLPREVAAAPSPAVPVGGSHLFVMGGASRDFVDRQRALRPATDGNGLAHPGFPSGVLAYHAITDTWSERAPFPAVVRADHESNPHASRWMPVTAPVVAWGGRWIVPSGEIKPGIRSPQVVSLEVAPQRRVFGQLNWAIVIAYLGAMVAVGAWFSRRERTTDDYFRAGKRIPWWAAGLSIFATMLSAITFMAIPARAYATDVSWYIGQLPILLVVPLVVFFYLPFFRRLDVTSAYEFLEVRFGLGVRLFASLSFMLFHVGRVAIVLYLPALALSQVSAIDVTACILIIGVLCVVYTVLGGIEAVVWTDAVQAIVLMAGAILCFVLVAAGIDGGIGGIWSTAVRDDKLFQSLTWDLDVADGTTSAVVLFIAFFFNSLVPYTSGQDVVQRYVTTRDEAAARRSLWTTMWLSAIGSMVFFALGTALYAFYRHHPERLDPAMQQTDAILPFFVLHELPPGASGLVIAAIFAAAQSTISSSLNSVATTWVTDVHGRLVAPRSSDGRRLLIARVVVVLLGAVGILVACRLAASGIESAFKAFNQLIGLTAGALGGLFALGVFTRRCGGPGALAAGLCGFAVVAGLALGGSRVSGLLYAAIGFGTCFAVGWVAGMIAPRGGRG